MLSVHGWVSIHCTLQVTQLGTGFVSYAISAHTGSFFARLKYIMCSLCAPVVQGMLEKLFSHLACILSRRQGAQYTAIFVHYEIAWCTATAVRDTIIVVPGHIPTICYALRWWAHWRMWKSEVTYGGIKCPSANKFTAVCCVPGSNFVPNPSCIVQCQLCAQCNVHREYSAWSKQIRNAKFPNGTFCSNPMPNKVTVSACRLGLWQVTLENYPIPPFMTPVQQ